MRDNQRTFELLTNFRSQLLRQNPIIPAVPSDVPERAWAALAMWLCKDAINVADGAQQRAYIGGIHDLFYDSVDPELVTQRRWEVAAASYFEFPVVYEKEQQHEAIALAACLAYMECYSRPLADVSLVGQFKRMHTAIRLGDVVSDVATRRLIGAFINIATA